MSAEASDVGEYNVLSIPQGGPIYIPDMVSPLTRVPDFELSVFNELQVLLNCSSFNNIVVIFFTFLTFCFMCIILFFFIHIFIVEFSE